MGDELEIVTTSGREPVVQASDSTPVPGNERFSELTLTRVEQLHAVRCIQTLFAGRLRCLDAKDWDSYGSFHTADVVSDSWRDDPGSRERPPVVGREALVRAIRRALGGPTEVTTVHQGFAPEITLQSDTAARGVWAMEDRLWWKHDGVQEHLHGYGHYHEQYRYEGGRWLISRRMLTRIRVDVTPGFFGYLR